jgi:hypothetical protein
MSDEVWAKDNSKEAMIAGDVTDRKKENDD